MTAFTKENTAMATHPQTTAPSGSEHAGKAVDEFLDKISA